MIVYRSDFKQGCVYCVYDINKIKQPKKKQSNLVLAAGPALSTGRPQVVICHQSGVFQGVVGDKNLGRFATKKVAIFEFLEKG